MAQLGERQTEDLKVPGSIPGLGMFSSITPGEYLQKQKRVRVNSLNRVLTATTSTSTTITTSICLPAEVCFSQFYEDICTPGLVAMM